MCKRRGRTARNRKRKVGKSFSNKLLLENEAYRNLLQCMKKNFQFSPSLLQVALFTETGRGISAKQFISSGETFLSIPKEALIGLQQANEDSILLNLFLSDLRESKDFQLTKFESLCIFLIENKRKLKIVDGKRRAFLSNWGFYVNVLPEIFSHPLFWNEVTLSLLPNSLRARVEEMKRQVELGLDKINNLIQLKSALVRSSFPDSRLSNLLCCRFTYFEYKWAWCCVNTRCIYSNHEDYSSLNNFYLAPFLDLLNHSVNADVEAKFNHEKDTFDITACKPVQRYKQVYIRYGDHSNAELLVNYGFVSNDEVNPNDVVPVTWTEIAELHQLGKDEEEQLHGFFLKRCLHTDCCFSYEGPSWSLTAALFSLQIFRLLSESCLSRSNIFKDELKLKGVELEVKANLKMLVSQKSALINKRLNDCNKVLELGASDEMHVEIVANFWRICLVVLDKNIALIDDVNLIDYDEFFFDLTVVK